MTRPFLINSNLCMEQSDIGNFDSFMDAIAGNTGNSYISYALIKELTGAYRKVPQIQSLYTYDFKNSDRDVAIINETCTHVFLVLQDQIRIHESYGLQLPYDKILTFLKKVRKPIVVAGLGANSLDGFVPDFHKQLSPALVHFLHELSDLVVALGVRGDFTHEVLNNLGIKNVVTIGCPSYYEGGANRVITKHGFDRLACSTGISRNIMRRSKIYLQDRQEEEARLIKAVCFSSSKEYSGREIRYIKREQLRCFSSIEDWKCDVAKNDFFIGVRVHGAILALNSGVPSVVMNGDSRAREMCEYLNIPYLPQLNRSSSVVGIYDSADYSKMNKEYGMKYEIFKDFMLRSGVELTDERKECSEHYDSARVQQPHLPLYMNMKYRWWGPVNEFRWWVGKVIRYSKAKLHL